MASCEYVPPASAQATGKDKDKEIDHLDLVSKYIQEKSHKIAKQKEREFKLSQRELNEFIMATYPVITPEKRYSVMNDDLFEPVMQGKMAKY